MLSESSILMAEEEIERTLNKSDQRDILVEMNGQELSLSLKIMTLQTVSFSIFKLFIYRMKKLLSDVN